MHDKRDLHRRRQTCSTRLRIRKRSRRARARERSLKKICVSRDHLPPTTTSTTRRARAPRPTKLRVRPLFSAVGCDQGDTVLFCCSSAGLTVHVQWQIERLRRVRHIKSPGRHRRTAPSPDRAPSRWLTPCHLLPGRCGLPHSRAQPRLPKTLRWRPRESSGRPHRQLRKSKEEEGEDDARGGRRTRVPHLFFLSFFR